MAGVFQHYDRHIRGHQLHLLSQCISQRLLAADCKDRHGQLGLGKFREIFGCLLEGDEIGPARLHSSWTSIARCISYAISFWNRMSLVGREVVPEMFKVNALTSAYQRFGCRPVEPEMPYAGVVVYCFPSRDTWQKGIHYHQFFHLGWELRGICISNH